jgi:transposase InsO family protein
MPPRQRALARSKVLPPVSVTPPLVTAPCLATPPATPTLVYHQRFATRAQAGTAIFDYIETFYNRIRMHSALAYLSPINFESKLN